MFEKILNLKGGSFSKTEVLRFDNKDLRVRKLISIEHEREFGLVRWQSQIRKIQQLKQILPENIPSIISMGVYNKNFYYEIPYYENSENLFQYLSKCDSFESKKIFEKLIPLIEEYSRFKYGTIQGSVAVFFFEEVINRLEIAKNKIADNQSQLYLSKDEIKYIKSLIKDFTKIKSKIFSYLQKEEVEECLTHGNLTLENILYDNCTSNIIMIDPYSETYSEILIGDISQLLQSAASNYEQINEQKEEIGTSLLNEINLDVPVGMKCFKELLDNYINENFEKDKLLMDIMHGAQFIRMFPFKFNLDPKLAFYFLKLGIKIIIDGINVKL